MLVQIARAVDFSRSTMPGCYLNPTQLSDARDMHALWVYLEDDTLAHDCPILRGVGLRMFAEAMVTLCTTISGEDSDWGCL